MELAQLVQVAGGSIGALVVGYLTKKFTAVPNGFIPLVNGVVFSALYAILMHMGIHEAIVAGMTAAYGATAVYEAAKVAKPGVK